MVQMLGWFRADAACASRWKRAKACASRGNIIGQELQRDEAMQAGVLGLVDHTHPTAADFADDTVMRDRRVHYGAVPLK